MKAFNIPIAFLFLFLCLCFLTCSKDEQADQDLEDDDEITEICVPELNTPVHGATLDNGCSDSSDLVLWSFDWEDCKNSLYNIVIMSSEDTIPTIDEWLVNSEYTYKD